MLKFMLYQLKKNFPHFFSKVFAFRNAILFFWGRLKIIRIKKNTTGLMVTYLNPHYPNPPARRSEFSHGGAVKLTYLAENFSHHFPSANLLYAVSSVAHPLQMDILQTAKRKGLQIIVNQNGVAFPAWDGTNYEASNRSLRQLISFADFIIYQSQFCKNSAERYIFPPDVPNEIIYNPVDTRLYSPDAGSAKPEALTLLLGGNQYAKYRLELALQTLKALHRDVPNARLIVTGNLWRPDYEVKEWIVRTLKGLNLTDHVTFTGTYTQADAPVLYSQAHLLLHTQYADSSPGLVLEALALGLPVVHLDNGGVPELVGDAGIGVHIVHDWDQINLPDPNDMANAVMQVYSRHYEYSQRARQRAVENFSLEKFIARHAGIFEKMLDS